LRSFLKQFCKRREGEGIRVERSCQQFLSRSHKSIGHENPFEIRNLARDVLGISGIPETEVCGSPQIEAMR
jgi:hypothetical protein